jgi:hypothetical protein
MRWSTLFMFHKYTVFLKVQILKKLETRAEGTASRVVGTTLHCIFLASIHAIVTRAALSYYCYIDGFVVFEFLNFMWFQKLRLPNDVSLTENLDGLIY